MWRNFRDRCDNFYLWGKFQLHLHSPQCRNIWDKGSLPEHFANSTTAHLDPVSIQLPNLASSSADLLSLRHHEWATEHSDI